MWATNVIHKITEFIYCNLDNPHKTRPCLVFQPHLRGKLEYSMKIENTVKAEIFAVGFIFTFPRIL